MADLVSLVLDIPSFVEGFIKLGRTIAKYQSLERDHVETVEEAIIVAEMLAQYASFVDTTDPIALSHPSRPLLEETLRKACGALKTAQNILTHWSARLSKSSADRERSLASSIANYVARRLSCLNSERYEGGGVSPAMQKVSYLAFGTVEIKEAMARLNKWTTHLVYLLLTYPKLRLQPAPANVPGDDVAFVAAARKRGESNIDVPIVELSHLESMFDIDSLHRSHIFRVPDGDYAGYVVDIRRLALRPDSIPEDEAAGTKHICRLFADTPADREYKVRASVGILPCKGYAISESRSTHYLLFRPPAGTGTPKTLRSILLSGRPEHPLEERLNFCIKLATSVLIIHSVGLVHKNIRPDSIIVTRPLRSDITEETLGTPYLLSFGQARDASGHTGRLPYAGEELANTLYIHPRHLASRLRRRYQMRDDIYSLGICLLEIGIWKSLMRWKKKKNGFACDFGLVQMSDEHFKRILKQEGIPTEHDKCWLRRDTLVRFAKRRLPPVMGNTFKDIVVRCLLFGEEELSYRKTLEKTVEMDSRDETADAQCVMFVQDILSRLRSLVFSV